MPENLNLAATIVIATAFLLSLATLFRAFQRHLDGKPLVAYEPRRRVPWGPLAIAIPVFFALDPLWRLLMPIDEAPAHDIDLDTFIFTGWVDTIFKICFVILAMGFLKIISLADEIDLGIPTSRSQFLRDLATGIFACLAALVPIYVVQITLTAIFQPTETHHLIDRLMEQKSPQLMLVGVAMAVVAAPIFEEFTFRLLFQGWLERWEDESIGFAGSERNQPPLISPPSENETLVQPLHDGLHSTEPLDPTEERPTAYSSTDSPASPPEGVFPGLPRGWAPILISGTAFGLAHYGQGVAPIPLVLFGIVLGYLYQRTHRLMPSIVAHMVFNAFSLGLLWLQLD